MTLFAEVLLPLPLPGTFTYRIAMEMNNDVAVGKRVVVQFGRKKIYTGLVQSIHQNVPQDYIPKYILAVLDPEPVVNPLQMKFWNWIAEYYMCHPGEVMNAALPSALKLASETRIVQHPDFNGEVDQLNEKEYLIAEAIDIQKTLTISEVSSIVEYKKVFALIKNLIEKKIVLVEEELKDRYHPKVESFVKLNTKYSQEKELQKIFDELEKRAFKQLELLMTFMRITGTQSNNSTSVKKSDLLKLANTSPAALAALEKKGVFEIFDKVGSRLEEFEAQTNPESIHLTEKQQTAFDEIKTQFKEKKVVLLHGVTSSGKTEIYIRLIHEALDQGKQVLFLLPEIALTTQIINRLRKFFGDKVGVYHSKYNKFERVEIWNNVIKSGDEVIDNNQKYQIILGARSALFLPYIKLGLVIVDEEHDTSYKQYAPAPRYQARDAAILLAQMHGAKTLLGSATPSVESYFNASFNKYGLVELTERYGGVQMPEILVADLKNETRRKLMKSHFSSLLLKNIEEALEKKEQVILFQNRRGFSLRLECESCNWLPTCKNCDVTLIYHKYNNQLRCHYCGYSTCVPERCPECGFTGLEMKGFGTEKIEDDLAIILPKAKIQRMDLDTTRTKNAYQTIISDFEEHRIDILVGTQMVTKGLDFDNVSVVGILNADNLISYPDFRSFERSFQMMAQVSGRAGRKTKRGKVIIQTYNPYHAVIRYVIDNNYQDMFRSQAQERRLFRYPPYFRLIELQIQHKDANFVNAAANELAEALRKNFGKRILGPEYPMVSRIKNLYLKNILIKLEKTDRAAEMKKTIADTLDFFNTQSKYKAARVVVDVDPL
ncbi:MAG: primosomal protein N' [Bacteroidales bacterium]|nr:primosomal protein N' [Bacteroidales bacterium]